MTLLSANAFCVLYFKQISKFKKQLIYSVKIPSKYAKLKLLVFRRRHIDDGEVNPRLTFSLCDCYTKLMNML